MRTLNSVAALAAVCLLLFSAGQTQAQCTAGSTLIVGPSDQYAFQWCNGTAVTSIGLQFASSQNEYQFKKTDGSNLMTLNPTPGGYVRMGDPDNGNYAFVDNDGDLRFAGTADLLVESNAYAFRARADEDNGLFFNVTLNQYEFRSSVANAGFSIKTNTAGGEVNGSFHSDGDGDIDGRLTVGAPVAGLGDDDNGINAQNYVSGKGAVRGEDASGGTVYAEGMLGVLNPTTAGVPLGVTNAGVLGIKPANGGNGAAVYGWNNDDNSTNYGGIFYADGTTFGTNYGVYAVAANGGSNVAGYFGGDVEITGTLSTGAQAISGSDLNSSNNIGMFEVANPGIFGKNSLGFDGNEIQTYLDDTATGLLYLQFWGGDLNLTSAGGTTTMGGDLNVSGNDLFVDADANEVGIGTSAPLGKLHITQTENTESFYLDATAGTSTEIMDINAGVMTTGQDIIDLSMSTGSSNTAAFIEASNAGIKFQVNGDGHVGVGTAASSIYALQACGSIRAEEVIVETGWCDYVFEDDYNLMDLKDVASYIDANKHLPGIPAASVIESEGMPVAEMSANFMEKIEELTLYTIEQDRQIDNLNAQIEELKSLIEGMND